MAEGSGESYPFGFNFQIRLLALAVREHRFIEEFSFLLLPQYFDHDELRHLTRLLSEYYQRFAKVPDQSLLLDQVSAYCTIQKLPEGSQEKINIVVDQLFQVNLLDSEWVKEEAVKFAQAQLMKTAILESYQSLNDPTSYIANVGKFQKILDIAAPKTRTLDFRAIAADIPAQMREHGMFSQRRKIKFGITDLDAHTFGGASCGKLGVVMAVSGVGKTHFLSHLGAQAIEQGYPVFHFSFGDMNEWEVAIRYAARFTNINSRLLQGDESVEGNKYYAEIASWVQKSKADLFISSYPALMISPSQLQSIISSMIVSKGVKPGLIIVDYADNMATGMKLTSDAGERSEQLGIVYQQLLGIAGRFEAALWTGSQVKAPARQDQLIEPYSVSGSIKKHDHADYIFSLNQTQDESIHSMARLYEGKIRFGDDKHIIPVSFDKSTSRFSQQGSAQPIDAHAAAVASSRRQQRASTPTAIEDVVDDRRPSALEGMLRVSGPFLPAT